MGRLQERGRSCTHRRSRAQAFSPSETVTNAELVDAFNAYADLYNAEHADAIAAVHARAKTHSSEEFIFKASGIEQRYVIDKTGILDPKVMHPMLRQRSDDEPSLMAEMALDAAKRRWQAQARPPPTWMR